MSETLKTPFGKPFLTGGKNSPGTSSGWTLRNFFLGRLKKTGPRHFLFFSEFQVAHRLPEFIYIGHPKNTGWNVHLPFCWRFRQKNPFSRYSYTKFCDFEAIFFGRSRNWRGDARLGPKNGSWADGSKVSSPPKWSSTGQEFPSRNSLQMSRNSMGFFLSSRIRGAKAYTGVCFSGIRSGWRKNSILWDGGHVPNLGLQKRWKQKCKH